MAKKKILVVLGGNSREREISLKTGKACIAAIKKLGHKVEIFDPKKESFFDIKKAIPTLFLTHYMEKKAKMVMRKVFLSSQRSLTHTQV